MRRIGYQAFLALSLSITSGCVIATESGDAEVDEDSAADDGDLGEAEQEIGGSFGLVAVPSSVGVVKVFGGFGSKGSGVIWKSWFTTIQGSYVLTVGHNLTGADVLFPAGVTVQIGAESSAAAFVAIYPSTPSDNVDLAIIRTSLALTWGSSKNFTRSFYTGNYSSLWGTQLQCNGYGWTTSATFGTLRWGWFQAQAYAADTGGLDHVLNLGSYPPPSFAFLHTGDSGGPCFNSSSQIVGLIQSTLGSGGGGYTTAMDAAVRTWIINNQF
jgi:hypothetical protein